MLFELDPKGEKKITALVTELRWGPAITDANRKLTDPDPMKIELANDRAPLLVVALLSVVLGRSLPVIASAIRPAPWIDDFLDRVGGSGTYFDREGGIGSTDSNTVSAEDKAAAERAIRNWDLFAKSDRETLAIAIARLSTSLSRRGSWAMPNLAIDDGILDVSIALEILYRLDSSEITHKLSTRAGWYVGSSEDQRLRTRKYISDFYGLRSGIIHGRRRGKKDQERASQDRKRALQVNTYDIAKATVLEHLKRGRGPARACVRPRRPTQSPRLPRSRAVAHEAEGRGRARGGGADRVGPPTGWHRLRQIGDELVPGVEQFLLVDDVVAVEDGAALVSGQEHGDPLGDVRADQVARGGAAAVVKEAGRHPSRLAGGAPRRAPAADCDAVAVEDQRAAGVAACPPSRQSLGDGGRDRENPPDQRLRARGREPDDAAGPIDLVPAEAEDLLLAPAGVVGEVEDVLPRGGEVGADGEVFGVLEEALAGGILAEPVGEAGHGVEPAPVDGERAHAVEGRGLPIDGAGGGPGGTPGQLVLADLVRGERGGPGGAAEERGEMGDTAASGAVGPELPDVVVLEVGVADSQGRPLGAERARQRRRCAWVTGGGGRAGLERGHGLGPSLVAAAGRRRPSTFALVGATGKGNVRRRRDGDVWGATRGG